MASTVVGFFDTNDEAQNAVEQLIDKGFDRSDIDVSDSNNAALPTSDTDNDNDGKEKESGVTRFFKNLFGSDDDEADRYSNVGSKMGAIVTVHTDTTEEAEKAADILDDYGAVDVDAKATEYGYASKSSSFGNMDAGQDYAVMTEPADMGTVGRMDKDTDYTATQKPAAMNTTGMSNDEVIPVIQEDLEVGKRTVQTGGVRVRSRIVERPVEESIRLRQEQVRVERTPVNRVLTDADMANFQEKNIELTETAEVPVVSKQARVVEEIRVGKEATEKETTIRDTVRNTEVDVENFAVGNTTSDEDVNTSTSRAL